MHSIIVYASVNLIQRNFDCSFLGVLFFPLFLVSHSVYISFSYVCIFLSTVPTTNSKSSYSYLSHSWYSCCQCIFVSIRYTHLHVWKMHTTTERCIRCWHIVSVGAYCMAWCIWNVCALCVCNFIPFVRCRSLNAVKMTIWIPLLFNFIISYSRGARVHQYVHTLHIKSNSNTKTITKLDLWHTIEGK